MGKAADSLARIALNAGRSLEKRGRTDVVDIITFTESEWGLGMRLHPVQRIILKASYGLPLDDDPANRFVVTDWKRENPREFTEAEYLRMLYQEGRCNIAEVIPGQERRHLILSIGRRSGKCVTGDTLLLTDKGIVRMDSFDDFESWVAHPGAEYFPLEAGVVQEGGRRSRSAYFYRGGHREIVRVRTHCGYEIAGTPNHRVRVMTEGGTVEWRHLSDFALGDVVAIHRSTGLWATEYVPTQEIVGRLRVHGKCKEVLFPDTLDEDWGLLLGMLVGDGHWTMKNSIQMTVEHAEMWEASDALFRKLLGATSRNMDKRCKSETGALQFFSTRARQFLHELGWDWSCGRYDKRVPWAIMKSPRSVVRAFLRGLFETDGGVEKDGMVVSFSTASERLAHEVQILLLNLGIVTRRKAKWNGEYERYYHFLTIRGLRSRQRFAELVGFMTHKKMDPLCAGLKRVSREGGDTESIPHQRSWCQRLLESVPKATPRPGSGWQRSRLREKLGNTIKPSTQDEMTYPRLEEALKMARDLGADEGVIEHFRELQQLDYFFDPVERVWQDEDVVYDLNVPDGESFVANGMTNHNTLLSSCIAAYETYRIISLGHPQQYYGLSPSSTLQLISVATGKDQAALLYNEVSGHFAKCEFFRRYMANHTMSYARFQTPFDIESFGSFHDNEKARASIRVTFHACNAKGLRGAGNAVVILDEVAHFVEQGGSSAEEVYQAVGPSIGTFTPKDEFGAPIDGPQTPSDGRMILISSPLGKQGLFYRKFMQGMANGDSSENMLCVQAPTWETNPTVSASVFKDAYAEDPRIFMTEWGGEFTDRTLGWLEDHQDLFDCIDKSLKPRARGEMGQVYFVGFDLGLVKDASAIAITHIDPEGFIVLDYIDRMMVGEGPWENVDRLDFEDVANWIFQLSRRFRFHRGIFDQWGAIPLEQSLAKKGLTQLEGKLFRDTERSEIWQNFKSMLWDKLGGKPRLRLYDITDREKAEYAALEIQPPDHLPYIQEILSLQATYKSKYIVHVEAPQTEGKHDDLAEALARSIWLASQHLGKLKHIARSKANMGVNPNVVQISSRERRINRQKRLLGGSDPKRQVSRKRRR